MLELSLKEIVSITNGEIYGNKEIQSFKGASTDTRKIEEGYIFFAFKGESFNGNDFIDKAFDNGASICVVDELKYDVSNLSANNSIIVVTDVAKALGEIAKYYLNKLKTKVVGVTGSCGKTSTKDMLAAALSSKYKVLKTIGNFNNGLGLPLTILRLDSSYDIAILEMGMSNAGEIDYLASIANPDMCVITNVGLSHVENLGSQENILKAKLECTNYFKESNTLVINGDDKMLSQVYSDEFNVIKVSTKTGDMNIQATNIDLRPSYSTFTVVSDTLNADVRLDLPGEHNITNYLLSVGVCERFGLTVDEINKGLISMKKTSMRLDVLETNGYTLINDCYNASVDSMRAAINVQKSMPSDRTIAILGPMYELGDLSEQCHFEVGSFALEKGVDLVLATGEYTYKYKEALVDRCILFETKEDLITYICKYITTGDNVLIKASRGAKFEDIYKAIIDLDKEN